LAILTQTDRTSKRQYVSVNVCVCVCVSMRVMSYAYTYDSSSSTSMSDARVASMGEYVKVGSVAKMSSDKPDALMA
jgi:hypothetical protein